MEKEKLTKAKTEKKSATGKQKGSKVVEVLGVVGAVVFGVLKVFSAFSGNNEA